MIVVATTLKNEAREEFGAGRCTIMHGSRIYCLTEFPRYVSVRSSRLKASDSQLQGTVRTLTLGNYVRPPPGSPFEPLFMALNGCWISHNAANCSNRALWRKKEAKESQLSRLWGRYEKLIFHHHQVYLHDHTHGFPNYQNLYPISPMFLRSTSLTITYLLIIGCVIPTFSLGPALRKPF